jgi:hypothetical protein
MSLPIPEPGLVISYAYLWRQESEKGRPEGTKNRPCAIVLVLQKATGGEKIVTVAPITHSPPTDPTIALELPLKVKKHLGLDAGRSWVVLDEFNEFVWPGFDLRPIRGKPGRYDFGLLPPAFFEQIIRRVLELRRADRSRSSRRD